MSDFLGVNLERVDTTQEHNLGLVYNDYGTGKSYIYVKSAGAIGVGIAVKMVTGYVVSVSGNAGNIDGICPVTVSATNEYFWMQTKGLYEDANVATGTAAGTLLSYISDANGDFAVISAFAVTGTHVPRGKALSAEAAGLADVLLF